MQVSRPARLLCAALLFFFSNGNLLGFQLAGDTLRRRNPGFVSPDGRYRPEATKTTDLIHTSLLLAFDWKNQAVTGQAVLSLKPHFYPLDSILLDARGFQIEAVKLVEKHPATSKDFEKLPGKDLVYQYNGVQLKIALPATFHRRDTAFVSIRYIARPKQATELTFDSLPVERGLYFINPDGTDPYKPRQLWTQGETTGGSSWFPTIEAPNEKITQDFFLRVESNQVSVSNGALIGQETHPDGTRTDHWRQSLPHAPYLAAVVVGNFSKTTVKTNSGIEVDYYVDPAYTNEATAIFGRTPEMIEFFSKLFDTPFPWQKYAQVVVRDFVAGAMENTTVTVMQEETQMSRRELLDGNSDALIAHELVHHWFGNLVTCEEWGQLPLNESFANYAEYLWEEHKNGTAAAEWSGHLELLDYLAESKTKNVDLIRYFYKNPDQMFDSHSYAKGGRVLHMLRKHVGDEAFFQSLALYLKKYRFGTTELANLRMTFEEITGEDLNWFFDQWFLRPGHPELVVSHSYLPAPGKLVLRVRQDQAKAGSLPYRLPLLVSFWVDGKKTTQSILLDRAEQEFTFPLEKKPDLVLFDSDSRLLGIVRHDKSKEEWEYQLAHSSDFLPRYDAVKHLGEAAKETSTEASLAKALDDPFWKIRQEALFQFSGREKPRNSAVETQVKNLVARDSHPKVRAEALLLLETWGGEKYKKEIAKALDDSSYAVVATAIGCFAKVNPKGMGAVLQRFQHLINEPVAAAIGDYWGDHPSSAHLDWFIETLQRLSPTGSYTLLQAFGKYLIRTDAASQKKGISFLEQMARKSASISVRYGAYQLISWFSDQPGVETLLKSIRDQEKDYKLLELYDGLVGK
ncbi:hypothetical protein GCM10023091_00940 [Ravibacter arvi]|uniref:Aminopeptidase N n=1 Tax=Ravibacter arvi TaxID=2051041 RepID=A0ABP8LKF5_9BACT